MLSPELLLEAEEPDVEPDFLELLLPEDLPSAEELDFDLGVVDLVPDEEAFELLPFDEVEGKLPVLPKLDEPELPIPEDEPELPMPDEDPVLPIPDEPVLPWFEEPELPLEDEPDVLPDMLPEF